MAAGEQQKKGGRQTTFQGAMRQIINDFATSEFRFGKSPRRANKKKRRKGIIARRSFSVIRDEDDSENRPSNFNGGQKQTGSKIFLSSSVRPKKSSVLVGDFAIMSVEEQAEEAIPAVVRMFSGCKDVQTSAE